MPPDGFRDAVRRIMSGDASQEPVLPRPDSPPSLGWLRRPDRDVANGEAWELPDGTIRLVLPKQDKD